MRSRTASTRILLLTATLAGFPLTSLAAQSTDPPRTSSPTPLRVTALDLELDLDYERPWIDGRAALTVENWTDEPAWAIPLLVGRLMRVDSVADADGRPLPFEQAVTVFEDWTLRQVTAVTVRLPEPVSPGDTTRIVVSYSGHLVPATETGMRYVRDHLDPAFSVLREESFAFPQVGVPSIAAMRSVPRRDFAFTARITAPDTLVVATGGEVVERTRADGRATHVLRSRSPVPFLNLPIAPYRVYTSDGVRAYLLPDDSARGPELLSVVDRTLAWFHERYGDLPRPPAFSLMEIPSGWGSQADLDAGIMIEAAALSSRENRTALYHELSHLWNAPDAEAPSPRWNEGLATYHQQRVAADLDGADLSAAAAAMAERVCEWAADREDVQTTPVAQYGETELTDWSYSVGAVFFHVLEGVMGQGRLDAAYRRLYQSTKTGSVSVDALEAALAGEDPRATAVFRDWIREARWYGKLCQEHGGALRSLVEEYRGG